MLSFLVTCLSSNLHFSYTRHLEKFVDDLHLPVTCRQNSLLLNYQGALVGKNLNEESDGLCSAHFRNVVLYKGKLSFVS